MDGETTKLDQKKAKKISKERIALNQESLRKIDQWLHQVSDAVKGIKLTRSDLVNHEISQAEEYLDQRKLQMLREIYFDPLKALRWAITQAQEAKRRGELTSIDDYLSQAIIPKKRTVRRPSIKKLSNKSEQTLEKP